MVRSGTGLGTLGEVRDGSLTNGEVQDWSGDPPECLRRVEYTMERTGRVVGPTGGPERVGGPSGRSRTGRGTFGVDRDGYWNPQGGPGRGRGPSGKFGMG